MKRIGNLFDGIVAVENLESACLKAFRGKNSSARVIELREKLTDYVSNLHKRLIDGEVAFGKYRRFIIHEPKCREISAPSLEEMIVQHAVMNVCHPHFERKYIYHSYASRPGKGIHLAVKTVLNKTSGYKWYVKLDIKKFFDSVDHNILKCMLFKMFKDIRLLQILYSIIDSYEVDKEKGLPIGNLTSQYFANLYMTAVDRYMLNVSGAHAYCRYMDDVVFMDNDKATLKLLILKYIKYCKDKLHLKVKQPVIGRTADGLNFLGYRISPGRLTLNGKSKRRFRSKLIRSYKRNVAGKLSDAEIFSKIESLIAFTRHASTMNFRKSCLEILENNHKGFMS